MRILKELAVGAETTEAGSEFQTRTTRHAKKWSLVLHLERGVSRRKGCYLDDKLRDGVNMSLDLIDENPLTILKHSIKSQISRLCSRDFKLRLDKRAEYDKF